MINTNSNYDIRYIKETDSNVEVSYVITEGYYESVEYDDGLINEFKRITEIDSGVIVCNKGTDYLLEIKNITKQKSSLPLIPELDV